MNLRFVMMSRNELRIIIPLNLDSFVVKVYDIHVGGGAD